MLNTLSKIIKKTNMKNLPLRGVAWITWPII